MAGRSCISAAVTVGGSKANPAANVPTIAQVVIIVVFQALAVNER